MLCCLLWEKFKPAKGQLFGFDQYPEDIPQFWADYKKEKVNKKDYPVNWKACPTTGGSNRSFGPPDNVIIKVTAGVPDSIRTRLLVESSVAGPLNFSLNPGDSSWVIQLNGQSHENEDRITAFYIQDDGSKIAVGHLDMVSYNKQDVKVVIVPVNKSYALEADALKDSLDKIYKSAITYWDVSVAAPLEVEFEENDIPGLDTELPDVAALTKEMRKIKKALKNRSDYDKDAYYLFLVDKSEKGDKNGIMPFRRHFGFIFMNDNGKLIENSRKLFHTIAHELGHGPFGLKHPWLEKGTTEGGTYNLMDYTGKKPDNLLRKYQWHYIHNPKTSWFGGDEEETSDVSFFPQNARYAIKVYSPFFSMKIKEAMDIDDKQKRAVRLRELIYESLKVPIYQSEYDNIKSQAPQNIKEFISDWKNLDAATYIANPNPTSCGVVFLLLDGIPVRKFF